MGSLVVSRDVAAPPETLWDAVIDVGSWPAWTSSIASVRLLDGELADGRRAVVKQPRLPTQTWTVTELEAGRSFAWTTHSAGITTEGVHEVRASGDDGSRIVLTATQTGILAPAAALVLGSLTRRYVELEAAGLKASAEERARRLPGHDI